MTTRRPLTWLMIATALLLGCRRSSDTPSETPSEVPATTATLPSEPEPEPEPAVTFPKANVLIAVLDTTRADRLSCYGYERKTSPHLDELAKESLLFERCMATSNWTLPSHASILTGLYPRSHGARCATKDKQQVKNAFQPVTSMKLTVDSLPELLEEQGYRTGAILANGWWLRKVFGLDQGIQDYRIKSGRANRITDEALAWIGKKKQQPFFLLLNYLDPHAPYSPPKPFDTKFLPEDFEGDVSKLEKRHGVLLKSTIVGKAPKSDEAWQLYRARYDGEIAYLDQQLHRLVEGLRKTGRLDDTLLVIVGDHGEAFNEHGTMGHNKKLYQSEIWVPLIVRLPGGAEAGRRAEMVSQTDIAPTLLELLGLPIPEVMEGRSLMEDGPRAAVSEFFRWRAAKWRRGLYHQRWSYLEEEEKRGQLFNLERDPGETADLAELEAERHEEMRLALAAWRVAGPDLGEAQAANLTPEDIERLKAIGYLR
ncbi:MAG: sulfatase [Acidobacteriota bacterium]